MAERQGFGTHAPFRLPGPDGEWERPENAASLVQEHVYDSRPHDDQVGPAVAVEPVIRAIGRRRGQIAEWGHRLERLAGAAGSLGRGGSYNVLAGAAEHWRGELLRE